MDHQSFAEVLESLCKFTLMFLDCTNVIESISPIYWLLSYLFMYGQSFAELFKSLFWIALIFINCTDV
jgi:hypothetical protein